MADKIKLFGRSYNLIGSSDADMIIKTKGQLKLQYGNKFIDLIKDGKLNVNSEFIFKAKSLDDITGNDGIYICDDGSIYLKVGDSVINLVGEVGTTYVAFLEEQETTSDLKHLALVNIGFLHETLDSVDSNSLRNGIIYVESEQKLYTIVDGTVTELVVNFPIPFTSQFVVAKTSSEKGAILIKGLGIENSLAFESMFVYVDGDNTNFDSDNNIIFRIGGSEALSLSMIQALFSMPVVSSMFLSPNANGLTGFRLYVLGGKSYLEVDNLIVRLSSDDSSSLRLFPEYWLLKNNIIKEASFTAIGEDLVSLNILSVELALDNEFAVGDIVVFYKKSKGKISLGMADVDVYDEDGNVIGTEQEELFKEIETYSRVEAEVTEIADTSITIKCFSDDLSSDEIAALSNQFIYLIKSLIDLPIRIKDNNIDIVEYSGENGALTPEVKTRVGKLDDLNLTTWNKGESELVAGHGFYSDNSAFKKAQYTEEVDLPEDDDSYKFASTHWVNKKIELIPQPGYYWSESRTNGLPVDPQFVGTDMEGFTVSETQPFLWKTNDGKVYTLVDEYVDPVLNRIYVASTYRSSYTDYSTGKSSYWPSGLLAYYSGENLITKFGKSNYVDVQDTDSNLIPTVPAVQQLATVLVNPSTKKVPNVAGYRYLWSIEEGKDASVVGNWQYEKETNDLQNLIKSITDSDWGNSSTPPGYQVVVVDDEGTFTGFPDTSDYVLLYGSEALWNDEVWRLSFLRIILFNFLLKNKNRYTEKTGWSFNYDGVVSSFGYGGVWSGRISGTKSPTSDDPNDIGYMPTSGLSTLSGYVIGNGIIALFEFKNVMIGLQLPYALALMSAKVGDKVGTHNKSFYKVSYSSFSVVLKDLPEDSVVKL